jgi:hypothetical protein
LIPQSARAAASSNHCDADDAVHVSSHGVDWVAPAMEYPGNVGSGSKQFFFEKKNQKTFAR